MRLALPNHWWPGPNLKETRSVAATPTNPVAQSGGGGGPQGGAITLPFCEWMERETGVRTPGR